MKKLLVGFLVVFGGVNAYANPYFRLADPSHLQMSAGFLIAPKTPLETSGVTDLALVTHSTKDGTIMPKSCQATYCPPEDWVPFQVGVGGSLQGNAIIAFGSSANLSPQIAAVALKGVNSNSAAWAQALKTALQGSGAYQIRIGGALAGNLVSDGTFQSAKEAFPGRGVFQIVGNASRIDFGLGWQF